MDTYILLCMALELKNTKIAKLLLARSFKDNENSTSSNSPLHFALRNNDTEVVKLFRDKGANLNVENFNGKTALHDAVERMKMELMDAVNRSKEEDMKILSSERATVGDNGKDAVTSCHIAADTGKHCPPLHLAVDKGNEEITELSVSKEANVNAKVKDDKTARHVATDNIDNETYFGDKLNVQF